MKVTREKLELVLKIMESLDTQYTERSGLRIELEHSLAKKLSRSDLSQLLAVVTLRRNRK